MHKRTRMHSPHSYTAHTQAQILTPGNHVWHATTHARTRPNTHAHARTQKPKRAHAHARSSIHAQAHASPHAHPHSLAHTHWRVNKQALSSTHKAGLCTHAHTTQTQTQESAPADTLALTTHINYMHSEPLHAHNREGHIATSTRTHATHTAQLLVQTHAHTGHTCQAHTQIHAHRRTHKHTRTQTPRSTQEHTRSVTHARTVRALARVRTHLHTHDKQQHTRHALQPPRDTQA
jgi:hypothetical protein